MKKCLIIIGILLGMTLVSEAQMRGNTQESKVVAVGLKGGLNFPRMYYYNNPPMNQTNQAFTLTPMGGLFLDIPLTNTLMMSPEVVYLKRGTDMSYEHHSGAQVHYTMSVHFVDVRLPFELRWPITNYFQPYLVLGAEAGMRLGGEIHMDRTEPALFDQTIPVGNANMGMIHAGGFAGVGIRSRLPLGSRDIVLKLSASVHQGLLDSYSAGEKDGTMPALNVNAYQPKGSRLAQGLEVCLGIAIPLEHEDDACATFSNDRRWFRRSRSSNSGTWW